MDRRGLFIVAKGVENMNVPFIDTNNTDGNVDAVTEFFHSLTAERFLRLGVPSIVYLRSFLLEEDIAYAMHSADGAVMCVVEDIDAATMLALDRGMSIVAVH